MKDVLGEPEDGRKCFINVCHCSQLPPPMEILDEVGKMAHFLNLVMLLWREIIIDYVAFCLWNNL